MRTINCNITAGTDAIAAAFTDDPTPMPVTLVPDPHNAARCALELPDAPYPEGPIGLNIVVMATGYQKFQGRVTLPPYGATEEGISIDLKAGIPPFPSRAEACSIQTPFQGFYVWSETFSAQYQAAYGGNGQIPLFGAAYLDFIKGGDDPQKLLAQFDGFTHVMLFLGRDGRGYNEPGQPYGDDQLIPFCEAADDLPWFVQQTDTVIQSGKLPMFVLDGEADPSWIRWNFERIVAALRDGYDRTQYGPFTVAFDGVWPEGPGWTPDVVVETIQWMRGVLGQQGYLFFWYGNGPAGTPYLFVKSEGDYTDPAFDGLDGVLTTSGVEEAAGVSMANKAQYMVRDPNFSEFQPSFHGPFILTDCPRGERFWGNIEWDTYGTVRDPNQLLKASVEQTRQMIRRMRVPCAG